MKCFNTLSMKYQKMLLNHSNNYLRGRQIEFGLFLN